MEAAKQNLVVKNGGGGIKVLPIGYRFRPTDEELIVHYLRRKVLGLPLPASVISELDVFHTHPCSLPGNSSCWEKKYFFCKREGGNGGCGGGGYWKHTGKARHIVSSSSSSLSSNNQLVGTRTSLVFRKQKNASESSPDTNTKWVMHEYCLVGLATIPFTNQVAKVQLGDWVVCSVFLKKKRPTNFKKRKPPQPQPQPIDFRMDEFSDRGPHEEEEEEDL
ncbi:NAC domain-containing protein 83 [Linum grandiflorum]